MSEDVNKLMNDIEDLRKYLHSTIDKKNLSDIEVMFISRELDKLLIKYHRLMEQKEKTEK